LDFLFGIENNRTVLNKLEKYCLLRSLEILDEGLITHLRAFRLIKIGGRKQKSRPNVAQTGLIRRKDVRIPVEPINK
jgi:hypothetical protein